MITKEQVISLLSKEIYEEKVDIQTLLKKYGIKESADVLTLVNELKELAQPETTAMISIYSNNFYDERGTRRVYMPLEKVRHNAKWLSVANLLCELLCGESIWSKSKYIIEEDGGTSEELKKTELFEKRFHEMINRLKNNFQGSKNEIIEFENKVNYLKNAAFRSVYNQTAMAAFVGLSYAGVDSEEIIDNLNIKKEHIEWLPYVNQEEFCCINDLEFERIIADKRGNNGIGFWMGISWIYCL